MPISYRGQIVDLAKIKYRPPDPSEIRGRMNTLLAFFAVYITRLQRSFGSYFEIAEPAYDKVALHDVVVKVDKRNVHSVMFHDISEPSEFREIALYCYWIIKLHPFTVEINKRGAFSDDHGGVELEDSKINESFACYLFIQTIKSILKKTNHPFKLSQKYLNELKYTFRYRDLNKATTIMLFEPILDLQGRKPQSEFVGNDEEEE